jgi:hypothetical protein
MRNGSLHSTLRAFAEDAAAQLAFDTNNGAEVPFELVEERRARRPTLYCYRPLTGAFIADRFAMLTALETYAPARHALERLDGLDGQRFAISPPWRKEVYTQPESASS